MSLSDKDRAAMQPYLTEEYKARLDALLEVSPHPVDHPETVKAVADLTVKREAELWETLAFVERVEHGNISVDWDAFPR